MTTFIDHHGSEGAVYQTARGQYAINQMDQMTQRNAAMVAETSAAIHKLSKRGGSIL